VLGAIFRDRSRNTQHPFQRKKLLNTTRSRKLLIQIVLGVVAVTAFFLVGGGRPAAAQGTGNELRTLIGSADSQKLLGEYKARTRVNQELEEFARRLDGFAGRLQTGDAFFLPEAEMRELSTLVAKPQPTADDTKRIGALETRAQTLREELAQLQSTSPLSDQQRTRLAQLTEARAGGLRGLDNIKRGYARQIDERREQAGQKLVDDVRAAIAKVAKAKNLVLVLDGAFALYAVNDITGDVLTELNK